ncbi:hypothetical protein PC128_g22447 [Phytophthora cactorum]|nr:hypothetical protein PC128_g22447 [Phytophthora cactorum]
MTLWSTSANSLFNSPRRPQSTAPETSSILSLSPSPRDNSHASRHSGSWRPSIPGPPLKRRSPSLRVLESAKESPPSRLLDPNHRAMHPSSSRFLDRMEPMLVLGRTGSLLATFTASVTQASRFAVVRRLIEYHRPHADTNVIACITSEMLVAQNRADELVPLVAEADLRVTQVRCQYIVECNLRLNRKRKRDVLTDTYTRPVLARVPATPVTVSSQNETIGGLALADALEANDSILSSDDDENIAEVQRQNLPLGPPRPRIDSIREATPDSATTDTLPVAFRPSAVEH